MDYPKMIAPGVAVIGRYEPSTLEADTVGPELFKLTENLPPEGNGAWFQAAWRTEAEAGEVRTPTNVALARQSVEAMNWHTDGWYDYGIVLWSNREQTEIQLPDGTILKPTPGDILLIHNLSVRHRTPPETSEDRWFFRRFVKTPDWMKIAQ